MASNERPQQPASVYWPCDDALERALRPPDTAALERFNRTVGEQVLAHLTRPGGPVARMKCLTCRGEWFDSRDGDMCGVAVACRCLPGDEDWVTL